MKWTKKQREAARLSAIRTWADSKIRVCRQKALKKANAFRTKEHAMKLGLAHLGMKASKRTRSRMAASHRERFLLLDENQCRMCTSRKHTTQEHKDRATCGRRNSDVWKQAVLQANRNRGYSVARFGQWYGKIWMRSGWECKFAEWLDQNGVEWKYEPKSFHVGRGLWSGYNYTPDFWIPSLSMWVEVKGWLRLGDRLRLQIFAGMYPAEARRWCMFGMTDLEALGIELRREKKAA